MTGLPTLTVRQPWASLIAIGAKRIETRSWRTSYRGHIAIHAAKRPVVLGRDPHWYGDYYVAQGGTWLHNASDYDAPITFGAIVATAELVDVVPMVEPGSCVEPSVLITDETSAGYPGPVSTPWGWKINPIYGPTNTDTGIGDIGWVDLRAELPYGDYTPGRYAWLLEDAQPTTERCPACWSEIPRVDYCQVCDCAGRCDPIPAKGKQGVWRWGSGR